MLGAYNGRRAGTDSRWVTRRGAIVCSERKNIHDFPASTQICTFCTLFLVATKVFANACDNRRINGLLNALVISVMVIGL
jgi:hypothetical protein